MVELSDLNTRYYIDPQTGEIIAEEIGKPKRKHIDFSGFWQPTEARPRMHPDPAEILGKKKPVVGKTYSVKKFYEMEEE